MDAISLLLLVLLIVFVNRVWNANRRSRSGLPEDLKNAELAIVERTILVPGKISYVAKPDRVYRKRDGRHIPVEFKSRRRAIVYKTDIAEVSLQAWVLRKIGYSTADYGYVRFNSNDTTESKFVRVQLMNDDAVEKLIQRYHELLSGNCKPHRVLDGRCNSCSWKCGAERQSVTR